ncbi:MAG: hypothetical protein KDB22_05310 [Planctomycetales bacterium]|nr:hypothetical protein [Planctomycetales bacterium]
MQDLETEPQPLMPRISMRWFFIVVAIVAVALVIVRTASYGAALFAAIAFTAVFLALFALLSGVSFLFAYLLGATERAISKQGLVTESPFSDNKLPDQIVPPRNLDIN